MTPVEFRFLTPTGNPISNALIEIQLTKGVIEDLYPGVVMPRLITVTTDNEGSVVVDLYPSDIPYMVSVYDSESDAGLFYKFFVPELAAGVTQVRLQDIIVDREMSNTSYDEAALLSIHNAKSNAIAASTAAQGFAEAAAAALADVEDAATRAETAATEALAFKNTAVSESTSASTSATTASTKASEASTSAATATAKATEATDKAAAASASASSAATSAYDALVWKQAADTFASNAETSAATAASKANEATTQADLAADRAIAALTGANLAEGYKNQASTSAANAAASASLASTKATAAETSATYASTQATAAAASATAALGSQNVASTKASEAATSATNSANSATESQTSASNAATSASNAASSATQAQGSATAAANSATAAALSASALSAGVNTAAGHSAAALAIYGNTTAMQTAVAQAAAQASLAAGHAASASSVVQQDLSGVNAAALHRSPNAVTAMFVYDTSKDSDGGAWTEKCQHTSWYNEPLNGKWLGAQPSENFARLLGASAFGPNLATNSTFSTSDLGTWAGVPGTIATISAGKLVVTGTLNTWYPTVLCSFTTVVGKVYKITTDIRSISGGLDVRKTDNFTSVATNSPNGSPVNIETLGGIASGSSVTGAVYTFTATATTSYFQVFAHGNGSQSFEIDNFYINEVLSPNSSAVNDYFQLTTDGKFYKLWKNLLSYTESLDNSIWTKSNASVLTNAIAAPDGTLTADKIVENTSNAVHLVRHGAVGTIGPKIVSVYAKAAERTCLWVGVRTLNSAFFDLMNVSTPTAGASITSVGNGWVRCSFPATFGGTQEIEIAPASNTTTNSYTGDGASGVYVWGAQVENGSTLTTYEPKTTDSTLTEVFRGNKREFPKLSAIVAEAGNVNIYDLTEPGRPMWMRFHSNSAMLNSTTTSVAALNGVMVTSGSARLFNFITDKARRLDSGGTFNLPLSFRNTSTGLATLNDLTGAVQATTPYVAMTVLKDAPVDPSMGIPHPTIGLAGTQGYVYLREGGPGIGFLGNVHVEGRTTIGPNFIHIHRYIDGGNPDVLYANPRTLISGSGFTSINHSSLPRDYGIGNGAGYSTALSTPNGVEQAKSNANGLLNKIRFYPQDYTKSIITKIANTYNTGHMVGDIRRTYLADTVAETVTGQDVISDPTFQNGIGDWVGVNATISTTGPGNLRATATAAPCGFTKTLTGLVANRTYRIIFGFSNIGFDNGSGINAYQGSIKINGITIYNFGRTSVYDEFIFTATDTVATLTIVNGFNYNPYWDLQYVYVTQAAPDRSYKNGAGSYNIGTTHRPALITGTLTKSPVATGSQLVAYSGFSA